MSSAVGTNQRIADRLLKEGLISAQDHKRVVEYATRFGGRVEDHLIELAIMSENDLLKFVSTVHSTRFVSSEKLYKAKIDPRLVARVGRKLAETHIIFPVLYDGRSQALSVVTPDPDNDIALHEVKLATGVKAVVPLVARPAAVRAAIQRDFHKDESAFAQLVKAQSGYIDLMTSDPFETGSGGPMGRGHTYAPDLGAMGDPTAGRVDEVKSISVPPPAPAAPAPPPPPAAAARPPAPSDAGRITPPPAAEVIGVVEDAPPPTSTREYLETLNVLVSLLDNTRGDLRGHSAMVSRLMRTACERIGLRPDQTKNFVVSAYLHDLGKAGAYHLTALNVSEYDGHKIAAQKVLEVPTRLMESVGLHPDTTLAVLSMYERYDGKGFPQGLAGKDIPLGARVLSVVDTYADLTQNPRNPYRKTLEPAQACEVLVEYRGTIFDPNVVDLFKQAMTGEDMRAKLLADRHTVLIVDPDPEETTVLELRLIERGFDVKVSRTAESAIHELQKGGMEIVISEIDLETVSGGLTLRSRALKEPWGKDVLWVILTRKSDRQVAQEVFDLGVDDFVSKPASTDIFVAKMHQLIERKAMQKGGAAAQGVSGSLTEMGLPEVVQILWHGRKTCALKIRSAGKSGEIHFQEGQIVNALWAKQKGEDAFYSMLSVTEGDFRLDPQFKPTEVVINASPEALLLEGMRRLDEGGSSGGGSSGGGGDGVDFDPFA